MMSVDNSPLVFVLQDNLKQLYKKLLSFLSHRNQKMEIFSLSVIAYLCLNDDIGDRVIMAAFAK